MTLDLHGTKLDAKEHPCPCVRHHEPVVHRTESHHVLPVYAGGQTSRPSSPGFTERQPICPTSHDAVHVLLDQWAMEEAAYLADGGEMGGWEPPPAGHANHVVHVVALQGWRKYKSYWPDKPFPRMLAGWRAS